MTRAFGPLWRRQNSAKTPSTRCPSLANSGRTSTATCNSGLPWQPGRAHSRIPDIRLPFSQAGRVCRRPETVSVARPADAGAAGDAPARTAIDRDACARRSATPPACSTRVTTTGSAAAGPYLPRPTSTHHNTIHTQPLRRPAGIAVAAPAGALTAAAPDPDARLIELGKQCDALYVQWPPRMKQASRLLPLIGLSICSTRKSCKQRCTPLPAAKARQRKTHVPAIGMMKRVISIGTPALPVV